MKRRDLIKQGSLFAAGVSVATLLGSRPHARNRALGQTPGDATLSVVRGGGFPNGLDLHQVGVNRPAYGTSWVIYDRLITFGSKTLADGSLSYDYTVVEPELAESWEVAEDGMSATFFLRQDATFHNGDPVTAQDVKWSYDRAVSVGGFPTFQMKAGALENPDQFEVVDDYTFRVNFLRPDKLTMIDMAVPIPAIINSELVKPYLTTEDPWGLAWVNANDAGSGAYQVETFVPDERLVLVRFEDWKSGSLPQIQRVIELNVPEAGNRRALMERGDVDVNFDVAEKDIGEFEAMGRFTTVITPIENCLYTIDLNTQPMLNGAENPLSDVKVRQAISFAVPYEAIVATAMYGQCVPMFGGSESTPSSVEWPQPFPYATDLDRAKALMAESGYPDGFATTLAFDLGTQEWSEPMCVLIQESLAQIGIQVTLEKVPSSNFRAVMVEKSRPMISNNFGGWLNFPDYFFFYAYHGQNATFNAGSYQNPAMDAMIDTALASFPGDGAYEEAVKGFLGMAFEEAPKVVMLQPVLSVVMQPTIGGYQYWFHRQLDYRQLTKA